MSQTTLIRAIKALPDEWIHDKTFFTESTTLGWVAVNPGFHPIHFDPAAGQWKKVELAGS